MAKKQKRQVARTAVPATREPINGGAEAAPVSNASRYPVSYNRPVSASAEFNPDYSYVIKDLKRIGVLAGSFIAILIALSFFLR